jgi:hypothetical protein
VVLDKWFGGIIAQAISAEASYGVACPIAIKTAKN